MCNNPWKLKIENSLNNLNAVLLFVSANYDDRTMAEAFLSAYPAIKIRLGYASSLSVVVIVWIGLPDLPT